MPKWYWDIHPYLPSLLTTAKLVPVFVVLVFLVILWLL